MVDYLYYFRPTINSFSTINGSIIFIILFVFLILFSYLFIKNAVMIYRGAKYKDFGIKKLMYITARLIFAIILIYILKINGQILLEFMQLF